MATISNRFSRLENVGRLRFVRRFVGRVMLVRHAAIQSHRNGGGLIGSRSVHNPKGRFDPCSSLAPHGNRRRASWTVARAGDDVTQMPSLRFRPSGRRPDQRRLTWRDRPHR